MFRFKVTRKNRKGSSFWEYPYITMDTLVDMWISFPNLSEQTKIAKILSDMDDEISALQDEIEKLKIIKQGAMDELLSGKIRLKG
ncbi:restriction endonuclease subunit S [Campylobacter concisus]